MIRAESHLPEPLEVRWASAGGDGDGPGLTSPAPRGQGARRESVCVLGSVGGRLPDVLPLGNELENSEVSYYHHHQPSLRTTTIHTTLSPCHAHPQFGHGAWQGGDNCPFIPATSWDSSAGSTGQTFSIPLDGWGEPLTSLKQKEDKLKSNSG